MHANNIAENVGELNLAIGPQIATDEILVDLHVNFAIQ